MCRLQARQHDFTGRDKQQTNRLPCVWQATAHPSIYMKYIGIIHWNSGFSLDLDQSKDVYNCVHRREPGSGFSLGGCDHLRTGNGQYECQHLAQVH